VSHLRPDGCNSPARTRSTQAMTPDKQRRMATAVGFLSGVLACLDALRDARIFWPRDAVWAALRGPQRFELGGGIALILVTLLRSILLRQG
jgi:hypothetical protein